MPYRTVFSGSKMIRKFIKPKPKVKEEPLVVEPEKTTDEIKFDKKTKLTSAELRKKLSLDLMKAL